jgi:predicted nucleic acid-binding Zn finger protein
MFHQCNIGCVLRVATNGVIEMKKNLDTANALVMASRGLVKRTGDHFTVYSDQSERSSTIAKVKKLYTGAIACNCAEYAKQVTKQVDFKCEHILAVRFAIGMKNTEVFDSPAKPVNNVLEFCNTTSRFIKETSGRTNSGLNLRSIDPAAKTLHDLITGRQLAMIREFAKTGKVNPNKECDRVWGMMPNELSRTAASAFISYLSSSVPLAAKELNLKHAA